jgi:PAS domain S-box-containing protein
MNKIGKVLIVDDNSSSVELISSILEKAGYCVHIERSGENVLFNIDNIHPDLILLDIWMPDMNGFEVCKILKENEKTHEIPILFLSASTNTKEKVKGFAVGGVDYITKPFEQEELLARVSTHLQLAMLKKEKESQLRAQLLHSQQLEHEIHEREKLEKELRESKERYKNLSHQLEAILDHIPGLVYYKDTKNNYIRVNKYVADAFRKNKKELEGLNLSEIHTAEIAEAYYQDDLLVIDSGVAKLNIEETWETETGAKWFNTSKIPFVDSNGKIMGIIGISIDITERKLYEKQILSNNKLLKELVTEKDKFFSIISHDLRSPFASIVSLLGLLAKNSYDYSPEELSKFAQSAHKTARSIYQLLENLLEWSRLQRGVMPFNPETINLRAFFKNSAPSTFEMAQKKQIELDVDFPDELKVTADPNMLHSIMRNLLTNAIKFTGEGGKIEVEVDEVDGHVLFKVKDTGIGMSSKIIKKLFQINQNVSRLGTNNEPSTGLGLIICKEFIEKHRGNIWVESEVGKGSCIYFSIAYK